MKVIVLAGGGGTRLWPLSRQDFPKQFLCLDDDHQSLLQKTVSRFLCASFVQDVVVATNRQYFPLVQRQLEKIDTEQRVKILSEPTRRNTAPAIALAVKYLQECTDLSENDPVLVIPSDHRIEPETVFLRYIEEAETQVKSHIVLFGVRPDRPETGYGYIQAGQPAERLFYHVERFVEKPDATRAAEYLAQGNYYWNAGIFAFCPKIFWEEMKIHSPQIFCAMQDGYSSCRRQFSRLPDISFDYAVLEKTMRVVVCPIAVSWSDIGSWNSLYEILDKDSNFNVKLGNVWEIDTKNSLIVGGKKLISTIGLEDMVVVDTDDAMFVAKKSHAQKVKELVQQLIAVGRREGSVSTLRQYNWGYVKPFYTTTECRVELMHIYSQSRVVYPLNSNGRKTGLCLSGEIEIQQGDRIQKIKPSQTFQNEELSSGWTIANHTQNVAEILLIYTKRD